jgi:hypothetical protein
MDQDFRTPDLYIDFENKINNLLLEDTSDNTICYLFGLIFRGDHYFQSNAIKKLQLNQKILSFNSNILKWIWIAQNGEDDDHETNIDYVTVPGILELQYEFFRAIEFQRPEFCFFFLLGKSRSCLNSGLISEPEYKIIYQRWINIELLKKHKNQLEILNNLFDETNCKFTIKITKNQGIAI